MKKKNAATQIMKKKNEKKKKERKKCPDLAHNRKRSTAAGAGNWGLEVEDTIIQRTLAVTVSISSTRYMHQNTYNMPLTRSPQLQEDKHGAHMHTSLTHIHV